ncbi:hypothetical protein AX14_012495 [Amanita brunnescens Koide BX004]|nr:hypothetical protein AX14_012495 [Amanita brunnescens Koide BX004]
MSTSKECPFYLGRTSKERHAELYAEIEAKFLRKTPKDAQAGITRRNAGGGKKKVLFSKPNADGFVKVGVPPGVACIDAVPSPQPLSPAPQASPPPPASIKPSTGSIVGAATDAVLCLELKGNEEA